MTSFQDSRQESSSGGRATISSCSMRRELCPARSADFLRIGQQRMVASQSGNEQIAVQQNAGQEIIEIVRHAAHHSTHGF